MAAPLPRDMTAIEIAQPGGPEVLKPGRRPVPAPGAGRGADRGGGGRREPAGRAAAAGRLCAAAGGIGYSRAGSGRQDRGGRRWRGCLEGGRQRLRAGGRRRLCRVLRGAGAAMPAGAGQAGPDPCGGAAGDLLHRLDQCVRPRAAAARRNLPGPWRQQRHRHHGDPARPRVRRAGDRHGGQRREMRRPAASWARISRSTTGPRISPPR